MSNHRERSSSPSPSLCKVLMIVGVMVLVVGACSSNDPDPVADTTTTVATAPTEPAPTPTEAAPTPTDPAGPDAPTPTEPGEPPLDEPPSPASACADSQLPTAAQYAVVDIPIDDPDGGLVARMLPDASSDAFGVLAEGTVVDVFADFASCAVTSDGAVWWNIGTPQLATGGWVNTGFLAPVGEGPPPAEGEDDFDVVTAQISCVYEGFDGACDILEAFGYPASDNFGLGNSLSQAPDEFLIDDCDAGDRLACAELAFRGGE